MRLIQILLILFLSATVYADQSITVKKDDEHYKKIKASVDIKEDPDNKKLLSVTVKIGTVKIKDHQVGSFYLMSGLRDVITKKGAVIETATGFERIKHVIKNNQAACTFKIDKDLINKSKLTFCYVKNKNPLVRYQIIFRDYTK